MTEHDADTDGTDGYPTAEVSAPIDESPSSPMRAAMEWVLVLGGAILLALVVRSYVLQAFSIPSESMESTLVVGDHVVVDKLSYRFSDIHRFDVVVFDRPPGLPSEYDELIKRVIGLPGDTVEGHDGAVFVNGEAIDEPYLDDDVTIVDFAPVVVPEGELFMMGDNRNRSSDSRVFGPISDDTVVGKARFRYWPLDRLGGL
ncbi:MAG: signal peptidase I [Acidimicrobiales bacterium]